MRLFDHPAAEVGTIAPKRALTRHIAHGPDRIDVENSDEVTLVLNLTSEHRVSGRLDGRLLGDVPLLNSVTVMPPGSRFAFEIEGSCRILAVTLPVPGEADGLPNPSIEPRLNVFDPALASLVWRTATASGDDPDPHALLSDHLYRRSKRWAPIKTGGIATARLRRVLDYIETGPGTALSLEHLAGVAGMSRFHFARAFAKATGTPPHQYVLGRRVARAIAALSEDRSVEDVAWGCGFANASHLAQQIRRTTGITPREVTRFAAGASPSFDY